MTDAPVSTQHVAGHAPDATRFREVLGQYPTGVVIVTARDGDGADAAMVVGSFVSVSLDPPLVAYLPQKDSSSYARIKDSERFVVSVLAADQEQLCRRIASKDPRKLDGLVWRRTASGTPVVEGCVAWIECELEHRFDGGDHDIVVGRVVQLAASEPQLPLLFFQGGYGRFSPLSLVMPTEKDLIPSLRAVETVRGSLEGISSRTGHTVLVFGAIGGELVLLASAAGRDENVRATYVGRRMPVAPPLGALFVADDPGLSQEWLTRAGDEQSRHEFTDMLNRVRRRGWSMAMDDPWVDEWDAALAQFSEGVYTPQVERQLHDLIRRRAGLYETEAGLDAETLRMLAAPVRDTTGKVILQVILLVDAGPEVGAGERRVLLDALLEGADEATRALARR